MKHLLTYVLLCCGLHATVITGDTSVTLHHGDAISFEVGTWNFAPNAIAQGVSIYPDQIYLALMLPQVDIGPDFAASVESADGAFSLPGALQFSPRGTTGSTPISALWTYVRLTVADSMALFVADTISVKFVNQGTDFTVAVQGQTLPNDLIVSLFGGPMSVGAHQGTVTFQAALAEVPEPGTGLMLAMLPAVLLARFARRITRRIS